MSRPNILREVEENVREQYFREGLRHPDSVLNERNYTQVMIEQLYKYGYYDPDKPMKQRLKDKALREREGLVKEHFDKQYIRLIAEYNNLLRGVDQQIEQRIHQRIQRRENNRKPTEVKILEIIIGHQLTPFERKRVYMGAQGRP